MNLGDIVLSEYGALSCTPSPVNRMMAEFAADFRDGIDINLGVGYVNERTFPDTQICEAVQYVLAHPEHHRQALNYGGPAGSANLIESIRAFHLQYGIGGLTEDILARKKMIIGANGATSILDALANVIRPGIVITTDPMYYIYCNALERKGFEVVAVPEDSEGLRIDALERTLAKLGDRKQQISFVYVVTVNNPTCTILSNRRRRELVSAVSALSRALGRKVPLILDKAYEFLIHDPAVEAPESAFLHDDLGIAYEIGTLSKILAPALRIGYLLGPDGPLMQALVQCASDVGFSAPLFNQEVASYLMDHHIAGQRERVNTGYREKARQTAIRIHEHLDPYLESCTGGQAGFYFYLTFSDCETGSDSPFFGCLTRTTGDPDVDGNPDHRDPRVVFIPGEYCVHSCGALVRQGRRQLRLSYGFEQLPRISEALGFMARAAERATKLKQR